jgi:hypothetical protein
MDILVDIWHFHGHFCGQMDIFADISLDRWTLSWTFARTSGHLHGQVDSTMDICVENGHYQGQKMDIVVVDIIVRGHMDFFHVSTKQTTE